MDFKIYKDKALQEPTDDPIDLGKVKAGETKQFTFYVYNSNMNPFEDLEFSVDNAEVSVISAPTDLEEKSSAEITLQWKPSIDVKKGLKTSLKIEGYEIIGG